jgi:glycosyltransferase involved in cell wall biosynthesis
MKILHVTYTDSGGGAGIAAHRLHSALLSAGIDSSMICIKRRTEDPRVKRILGRISEKIKSAQNIIIRELMRILSCPLGSSLNIFPTGLHKKINRSDADIVHLHWLNAELISIREIAKIKKPIVWSLHDLWPLLGAEHYPISGDNRYIDGYTRSSPLDVNAMTWLRKKRAWENFDPVLVSVGAWGAEYARQSALFNASKICVIPNTLDVNIFKPEPKYFGRTDFNLPLDKKILLFGSATGVVDPRKGYDLLAQALENLNVTSDDVALVVFGGEKKNTSFEYGYKTYHVGRIADKTKLARLYSAVDIMCVPSRLETFGQTASEAMSCGTPVIAFDGSGISDIVDHKINGYLAKPYNISDYAQGIEWLFRAMDNPDYQVMSQRAREKVTSHFSFSVVAEQFCSLYKEILK